MPSLPRSSGLLDHHTRARSYQCSRGPPERERPHFSWQARRVRVLPVGDTPTLARRLARIAAEAEVSHTCARCPISPIATSKPCCTRPPICGAPHAGTPGAGARRGRARLRQQRQALHRRPGRAVVHRTRLRQRRADRGGARADVAAVVLASVRRAQPRAGHRAGREAKGHCAVPDLQGVLHLFGLGGQRHAGQARLVLQQRARPAEAQEDHRPHARLSRHDGRDASLSGLPVFHADFDLPMARRAAHRLPALRQVRRAGRERGGLREPARRAAWRS